MSKNTERRDRYHDSDSDSDSDCRRDLKLYKRMKKLMMNDPELMVTGAECYADVYNTVPETLAIEESVKFEFNNALAQVEHLPNSSDITIKKSGIYLLINILNVNDPSQWAIFINDHHAPYTTTGVNGGALQSTRMAIASINCGDVISVRNHVSPKEASLTENAGGDGTHSSVNARVIAVRIAPFLAGKTCRANA
jgi:hypothetical protein